MRVDYHPAIEAELREIKGYYDDQSPGLGSEFIDEFGRQVLALVATPERWMVGSRNACIYDRANSVSWVVGIKNGFRKA